MSIHSAGLCGESAHRFFTDAETFLRCELAADMRYGLDAPTIHYDVYNIEAEALGVPLIASETDIPTVDPRRPPLLSPDEFTQLPAVKPGHGGRMPFVLEINRRLTDMGLAPKVRFTGLFSLAAALLGLPRLVEAVVSTPDKVHRLMEFLTLEVVAPWIVRQREDCGVQATATGSDALASPPILSPALVREYCLKYVAMLEEAVGGVRLAGLWGESFLAQPEELLEIKRQGSQSSIQVLDPDVTALGPALFREYADRVDVSVVMGMDANLINGGTPRQVRERARRFIEEGGIRGRFVLFMNDIPYDTPPGNVDAVVATAREYVASSDGSCYVRR